MNLVLLSESETLRETFNYRLSEGNLLVDQLLIAYVNSVKTKLLIGSVSVLY
ncbi:hypothetical protein DEHRE_10910 [Dehalobacter restrictus DSM 9455]|uniref:Uncharacterized protein n=1 Tax=Dehalobacter restrictus (strain DSM 9455 / PER-K23) TaxID=871738 RepID=A0ABN4C2H7_DEHRP|nr:hypothetical protein DEHRE_10910 [Dehalobacter restrictus DSM 9455]